MNDLKQRLNLFSSNPVFGGIIEEAKTRIEQLEAELETERMRLVACGVVATANTPESAAKARDMLPQYRSGSCEAVEKAVDREVALRDRVEQLEAENAEWKEKAKVWMASPEAAEQLDGYRAPITETE